MRISTPSALTWRGLALASLLSTLGFACGPSVDEQAGPLRIVTWNAHNLFDDRPSGGTTVVDTATYRAHLAALAQVLGALSFDIAVLEEVEGLPALDDLAATLPEPSAYPVRVLREGNDPRGINIGVLSRMPFDSVISHKDDVFGEDMPTGPFRYSRDCLELHLVQDERHLVLLGVHFKSRATPDEPEKRLAEAEHTRAIADRVTANDPAAAVLVLGDFNDTPDSPAFQAIQGAAGEATYRDAPASLVPPGYSYVYEGERELLDHQMANATLSAMLDEDSVLIVHSDEQRDASDHAPLLAAYDVR